MAATRSPLTYDEDEYRWVVEVRVEDVLKLRLTAVSQRYYVAVTLYLASRSWGVRGDRSSNVRNTKGGFVCK